jgi:hypothetical protein
MTQHAHQNPHGMGITYARTDNISASPRVGHSGPLSGPRRSRPPPRQLEDLPGTFSPIKHPRQWIGATIASTWARCSLDGTRLEIFLENSWQKVPYGNRGAQCNEMAAV